MIPQVSWIFFTVCGFVIAMKHNGEERKRVGYGAVIVVSLIILGIFAWGGFFNNMIQG